MDEADLKKESYAPTRNSGNGVMAAAARDHDLFQLKASMRRSKNKSGPTSTTGPTAETMAVSEANATTTTMTTTDRTLWERARSHHLLQAKAAMMNDTTSRGDNSSLADNSSYHFSIESFVDDDMPDVEIVNPPHELLQAKSYIRSSGGAASLNNNSCHNQEQHLRSPSSATSSSAPIVGRYRYQAPTTMPMATTMPNLQRDPTDWIQSDGFPGALRVSSCDQCERENDDNDNDDDDPDAADGRSAEDTLALTATVVDEEQERQRIERQSRQTILDELTPAVHAEVVDLKKRRRTICVIVACVLVVIVALTTALSLASRAANDASPTMAPTVDVVDVTDWVTIINNITLSGKTLAYPPPTINASVEEQALAWIIDAEQDMVPVRLAAQHYAIVVLALEWNYTEWNLTAGFNECDLVNVWCDLDGNVFEIDLKGLGLTGSIPPDIALLTNLSLLILNKNALAGTVPWVPMMKYMTKMEYLDVDYNSLTGPLPSPWNGTWPAMRIFWAAWNEFTGTISPGYAHWSVLKDLYILDNRLTGTIPSELGELSTLYWFSVGENYLEGSLPTEIGRWSKITHFEVHQTGKLNGTIPTEVGSWTLVKDVFLHSNQMSGTLPTEIGNWKSLNRLRAEFNGFSGTLPDVIGNWLNTTHFHVNNNYINGTVPAGIKNWTALEGIELNNNRLSGTFPSGLESWEKLKTGAFFVNNLTGSIEALCGNESRATLSADCCELNCSCCKSCFVDHDDDPTCLRNRTNNNTDMALT